MFEIGKRGTLLLGCLAMTAWAAGCAVTKPAQPPASASAGAPPAAVVEPPPSSDPSPDPSPALQARAPVMYDPEQWSQLSREGRSQLQLGQLDQAEQSLVAAQELSRSFRRSDVRRRVSLRNLERLGLRYAESNRPRAAVRVLQIIADETRDNREGEFPGLSTMLLELGDLHTQQGAYDPALRAYRRALDLRIEREGRRAMSLQEIYERLVSVYLEKDEVENAARYAERSRELAERSEGNDTAAISAWVQLGNVRLQQKRYDEAIAAFEAALETQRASSPEAVNEAVIRNGLANALLESGRPNAALAQLGPALAILEQEKVTGALLAATLDTQAQAYARVGSAEEAGAAFERVQVEAAEMSAVRRIELLENYENFLLQQDDTRGAASIRRRIEALGSDGTSAGPRTGQDLSLGGAEQRSAAMAPEPTRRAAEAGWDEEPAEVIPPSAP